MFSTFVNPKTGRFKRELTVSLRTTDPRQAKRRDLQQAAATNELLEALRLFLANPKDHPATPQAPVLEG
ncbi:DUF6538 domain-containing protein [Martelella soudanensis]|uniref:DUF6538 domain-containing protein n=1 Tax=unclassified Martelella TaxID=2629616 RepID=UPI0035300EFC